MSMNASFTAQLHQRDQALMQAASDYANVQSLPEVWEKARSRFGNTLALWDPHATPPVQVTYRELVGQIQQFAAGIQALGLPPISHKMPPRVALFANDSPRWIVADQGLIYAGAADVVRGSDADREELLYILQNSGSHGLVVENLDLLEKLGSGLDDLPLQWVVLLSDEDPPTAISDQPESLIVYSYDEVMGKGANRPLDPAILKRDMLATLLYTSGTTGKPKGVMLTHGNLLHQINTLVSIIQPQPGDRILGILPTWHSLGRVAEYFVLSQGCTIVYTSIRHIKRDFAKYQPKFMIAVPRLWESIYEGVQKQFREQPKNKQKLVNTFLGISERYILARRTWEGLRLDTHNPSPMERSLAALQMVLCWPIHKLATKLVYEKVREATGGQLQYVISGGGSLAMHLETFFEIVGLEVLVGYGLTETSPVLTARRYWRNLRGSAGLPIPETEIKIVDPETRQALPVGDRGLVLARGPQVMQGYFNNPEATSKAIDAEGWFDTGDLGLVTTEGHLVLTGRAKDTIVLTNGENIEPQPIEDACIRSPYIDQIMLVGQDQKYLGALIVPNFEALEQWAASQNLQLRLPEKVKTASPKSPSNPDPEITLDNPVVQELFRQEINREVKNRPGYRPDDRIGVFRLITEPFSLENGLMTQTLKIKRPVVSDRYRQLIDEMFR